MYILTPFAVAAALVGSATAVLGDCRPLQGGNVTMPTPNTPEAFASFKYYDEVANSTSHPIHYERFMAAENAAIHDDNTYITYKELPLYDVSACAEQCDSAKDCASFNIYFQRHPSLAPGPACPNPEANVVVRCALFRAPMSESKATNQGQTRGPVDDDGDKFEVLMRGSNAYNRLISPSERATVTATVTVSATKTVVNTVVKTMCVE